MKICIIIVVVVIIINIIIIIGIATTCHHRPTQSELPGPKCIQNMLSCNDDIVRSSKTLHTYVECLMPRMLIHSSNAVQCCASTSRYLRVRL